jgi:hypothetical protein
MDAGGDALRRWTGSILYWVAETSAFAFKKKETSAFYSQEEDYIGGWDSSRERKISVMHAPRYAQLFCAGGGMHRPRRKF